MKLLDKISKKNQAVILDGQQIVSLLSLKTISSLKNCFP
jgi:hypothetical protein